MSFSNTRESFVANYDGIISAWNATARADFKNASFSVTASSALDAQMPLDMTRSTLKDFDLRDAEGGEGVYAYQPLKYTGVLRFPTAHLNASYGRDEHAWELLPARADAATVTFDFMASGRGGRVGSVDVPLAFGEELLPSSEYPDSDCRSTQHGVWRGWRCHISMRLAKVCLVLEPDGEGGWRPTPWLRNGTVADAAVPPLHGCDPLTKWDPAAYVRDPCWGPWPNARHCGDAQRRHVEVEVTLRSVADPFLRAEELTRDRFDFGPSEESQWISGLTFTTVGCLLAIVPLLRLSQVLCPCRLSGSSEERQGLSDAAAYPDQA